MVKLFSAIALVFLLCLGVSASPVQLEASRMGFFDRNTQVLVGEGNVVLSLEGLKIESDRVVWDIQKDEIVFQGNVRFVQEDQTYQGEELVYYLGTNTGEITRVRSVLEVERAKSPVFLGSDVAFIQGDDLLLSRAFLTTCDHETPHFGLRVKSIMIYPGDKMVLRQLVFYEGVFPLFFWPYLVWNLNEENQMPQLPQIGYGKREGWYIKTSYRYTLGSRAYGNWHLDYYTRLGVGAGFTHNYDLVQGGAGQLYLYVLPQEQEIQTSFKHELKTDRITFTVNHTFSQAVSSSSLSQRSSVLTSNYSFRGDKVTLTLGGDHTYDLEKKTSQMRVQGNWQQKVTDTFRLRLQGDIRETASQRLVNYLAESTLTLKHRAELKVAVQQRYNPDLLDEDKTPNWSSVSRVPEITLTAPNLGSVPGRLDLGIGKFVEFPTRNEAIRTTGTYTWNSSSYRLGSTTSLRLQSSLQGSYYDTGVHQGAWYGEANTTTRFSSSVSLTTKYTRREIWGETPFRFDQLVKANKYTGNLDFRMNPVNLRFGSGYDFLTQRWDALTMNAQYQQKNLSATLGTTYEIQSKSWGVLTSLVRYREGKTEFSIGGQYNLASKDWRRVDGKISFDLSSTIRVNYELLYDFTKDQFTRGELGLTFDLHCREVVLKYNHVRQEIWLQYVIKAFPELPFRFRQSEAGILFEYDELTKILQEWQ